MITCIELLHARSSVGDHGPIFKVTGEFEKRELKVVFPVLDVS